MEGGERLGSVDVTEALTGSALAAAAGRGGGGSSLASVERVPASENSNASTHIEIDIMDVHSAKVR